MRTIVGLMAVVLIAGNWPQFRGPNCQGVAEGEDYPIEWSQTKNVAWKAELPGRGVSSPVVWEGKVIVTACTGYLQDRLHVLAFDQRSGKKLWHRQLRATGSTNCNPRTCMAAPTPVVDETGVYALFATGDLAAFDLEGNLRWYRALVKDYPDITNQVGMASSPILWRDRLIVPMDNAGESFLAAVDTSYGRNLWKVDRPAIINWVAPVIRETKSGPEVLFQSEDALIAYDPASGKERWRYQGEGMSTIPSTIVDKGRLYATSGGVVALEPPSGKAEPKELWKSPRLRSSYSSPLIYEGAVYNVNPSGVLVCVDPDSGDVRWQERIGGRYWASLVVAAGKIYLTDEDGTTTVVDITGKRPRILSANQLDETMLATPAFADGMIFLRSDEHLWAIK